MKRSAILITLLFALLGAAATVTARAQNAMQNAPAPEVKQDPEAMRSTVKAFLETQAAALPGRVEVKVGPVDSRLNAPACAALEAYLPGGSKPWGRTTVGVRCLAPVAWTRYVSAQVSVFAEYLVTAAAISQGQVIAAEHLMKLTGDLTALPAGMLTDPAAAIGRTAISSLAAGTPLRRESLRVQPVVQQGQLVHLVTQGPGFKASTEARAISNAGEGQVAQARTPSGAVISGIARAGGVVEVAY